MTLFLVLLLALVVSTLVLALLLRLAPRTGLMDHPGERRRIHREAVPRVGGLAIFAGLLASLVVAPPLTAAERYGLAGAALLLSATLAALVPYLVGNLELGRCRCKVFLGDAGSMLLGYLLVWGLIAASRGPAGLAPVTALWLVAIPLMDTLAVMGRRLSNGQHPFRPDRGHLHHRLARLFHSPRRALILLLALAVLLAGVGLAGQALAVPEALMFALALAVFGGYLAVLYRWPDWHRRRLRLLRQAAPKAGG